MANRPQFVTPKLVSRTYAVDRIPLLVKCDLAVAKLPDSTYTVDGSGYLTVWVSSIYDNMPRTRTASSGNRTITYEYDRAATTVDLVGCDIELIDPADCVGSALLTWMRKQSEQLESVTITGFAVNGNVFTITTSDDQTHSAEYQPGPHITGMDVQGGVLRIHLSDNSLFTATLPASGGGGGEGGDPGPPGPAGNIVTVTQASHGFLAGKPIRYDQTLDKYVGAQADTAEHAEVAGVVCAVDGNDFSYIACGPITGLAGLVPGKTYFLSASSNALTATDPHDGDPTKISKPVLIATSASTGIVQIQRGLVQLA